MKKKAIDSKTIKYVAKEKPPVVEEPTANYMRSIIAFPSSNKFTYKDFKTIAESTPFTIAQWALMLHVSERTLQRYAKNNSSFAPINAERALQIIKLIKKGIDILGSVDKFYNWLNRNPYMLEGNLSLQSLTTSDGINDVLTQLNRIEQGLFA
jgi:putative toxin-antitoxin system antitoxin component (TIGR02293 family)